MSYRPFHRCMFINCLWFIEQAWETVFKPFTMKICEVIWVFMKTGSWKRDVSFTFKESRATCPNPCCLQTWRDKLPSLLPQVPSNMFLQICQHWKGKEEQKEFSKHVGDHDPRILNFARLWGSPNWLWECLELSHKHLIWTMRWMTAIVFSEDESKRIALFWVW